MKNKNKRLNVTASGLTLCLLGLATSLAHAAVPQAEYDKVIRSARDGQAVAAAETLQNWQRSDPDNIRIVHDLVVVLGWAGKYDEALGYRDRLLNAQTPAYVLKSLGNAALAREQWDVAIQAYELVLKKSPKDNEAHAGIASAWLAQGRSDEALSYVRSHLPARSSEYAPADVPLIMILGRIHRDRQEAILAANAYRDASRLDPTSREAFRAYVFTLNEAGMPYLASQTADQRLNLFSQEERREIAHAAAGTTVNFGQAQLGVDHRQPRFATTDAALDDNASVVRHFGERPVTTFDRMVALRDRQRMREVVQLYEELHAQGVAIPPYARAAAADAYLYLQQPEQARDLYLSALEEARTGDVASVDSWRIGLTYAYTEAEQHREAQKTADDLLATTPQFSNWGIRGVEAPNDDYPVAATLAGLVKLYSNRLKAAEQHLGSLKDAAPFNPQVRTAWSELKMARGHYRAALEEYTLLGVDQPEEMGPVLGKANAHLALNQFSDAKAAVPVLNQTYPENKGVQRFTRLVDIYDRPYLEVTSTFGNGGGQAGAQSVVEARLYSAPLTNSLGDPWRVYSRLSYANGDINAGQADEISASRSLIGVGVDYRVRDWTVEAEVNRAISNANRSGVAARVTHDFSDQWQARLEADTNVNDLAARAFNAGVTARRYTAGLTWRQNESRSIDGELSNTQFSDGNRRDAAVVGWTERWISGPVFTMDSLFSLATSRNSLPNAVYFNPASDREATIGLNAEWLTWRRYQRAFTQKFQVFGGRYKQESFNSGSTSGAQYGHQWAIDDAFRIEYGVGTSTHPYDGVRERRNYGYLNLNWAIK